MPLSTEKFVKKLIKRAGREVLARFKNAKVKYVKKDPIDIVTEADLVANKIIVDAINRQFPDHGIISEELGEENINAEYVWIIDPLDGTKNFAKHIPVYCVMIALAKNGKVILAAIYDPVHDELFYAEKGKGAFLNGKKISPSKHKVWELSFGESTARVYSNNGHVLKSLVKSIHKKPLMTISGSAGLSAMHVAAGRRDWFFNFGSKIWDYAAPYLILTEAGCKVTNIKGRPWSLKDDNMLAANKYLYRHLFEVALALR